MAQAAKHRLVTFGVFEVDLDTGEIRRAGLRVRLSGQPFRLLLALLSRPGEIITRGELQQEIWGSSINIDFERGIAGAVNKVREALGDSAEQPRYIETVARKGYRFIAPVTVPDDSQAREEPHRGVALGLPQAPAEGELVSPDPITQPLTASHSGTLLEQGADTGVPARLQAERSFANPASSGPQVEAKRAHATTFRRVLPISLWAALAACSAAVLVLLTFTLTVRSLRKASSPAPPRLVQLTQSDDIYPGPPNPETLLSLATDGPRVYAPVLADGRSQISSFALDGTDSRPVSMPGNLSSGAISGISGDGAKLLIRSLGTRQSEQPLWIAPTTGSGALRVGEVLAHDAAWMPGSEDRILSASGNELMQIDLGTGAATPFASLPGRAFWLRWSPDGTTLRFTLLDPVTHSTALWQLDAKTRHAHPLTLSLPRGLDLCCGSWTPSGKTYIFQARNAQESNIWAVLDGAGLVQLTNGPVRFTSPLPTKAEHLVLAFGAAQPGNTRMYDRQLQRFVPAPAFLRQAERASFSRDGAWVAWTDHDQSLWRARSKDGSDLLRLTGKDLEVFSASWSPDGKELLLMARHSGETWQIYTVSPAGGSVHRILSDKGNLADPQWSSSGDRIIFGREADLMGQETGPHNIQLLDLRSRQLTPVAGSTDLFSPRWSPDGRWLAALSRDQQRLLVCELRTGTWRVLFTGSAADPVWSTDSRSVYFHAFASANPAILRAGVEGGVETVADLAKAGLAQNEDYFFTGLTPDGSPLIEPRVGTGNLFSLELPSE